MEAKKPPRGGAGRGQGRKPLQPGAETVVVSVKMTAEQRAKLARLGREPGGAAWIRARIDKAREPGEEK
jgi:hypothetical protein